MVAGQLVPLTASFWFKICLSLTERFLTHCHHLRLRPYDLDSKSSWSRPQVATVVFVAGRNCAFALARRQTTPSHTKRGCEACGHMNTVSTQATLCHRESLSCVWRLLGTQQTGCCRSVPRSAALTQSCPAGVLQRLVLQHCRFSQPCHAHGQLRPRLGPLLWATAASAAIGAEAAAVQRHWQAQVCK